MIDTDYLETHFEISAFIGEKLADWDGDDAVMDKVNQVYSEQGRGGVYELAEDWTNEFQTKHKDTVWGVDADYFDTLDEFLKEKNEL